MAGVDYFYLDDGLGALSYEGREHSFTKLDGLDLNLTIESRSVAEAEDQTLMQGGGKMFQAAVGMGASDIPAPAKHGSRVVAGMKGEELLLRSQAGGSFTFGGSSAVNPTRGSIRESRSRWKRTRKGTRGRRRASRGTRCSTRCARRQVDEEGHRDARATARLHHDLRNGGATG